jgi:hypothetical protein
MLDKTAAISGREVQLVDPAAVSEFIKAAAEQARRACDGIDGILQLNRIHPADEEQKPVWSRFAVGDIDAMIGTAVGDAEAGHNVYIEPRLLRRHTPPRKRGDAEWTAAVWAVVIDSDADTGKDCEPSLTPSLIVETSPGNRHYWYFLDRAISDAEASTIGSGMRAAGGDSATGRTGLYRVPGAVNFPDNKKQKRGRIEAHPVRLIEPFCGVVYTADKLREAFPPKARQEQDGGTADESKDWSIAWLALPDELRALIRDGIPDGVPNPDRSAQFHHAVGWLKQLGWGINKIVAVLEAHPKGIAEKYAGRLRKEVMRSFEKVEGPEQTEQSKRPSRIFYFSDCDQAIRKEWLLKGLMAAGESSSCVGPPGSGKSGALTAIAVHIASGRDWRGFRNKRRCAVAYFALERGVLVRRRLAAYKRMGFADLPIAVVEGAIDLLSSDCPGIMLAAIKEIEERLGEKVGLIIIDTFGKGIALGGGDENQAKDQNKAFANLQVVRDETGAHTAVIHHTGKDESRGPRGSNAMLGDVDLQVQISGADRVKTAKATKANDQAEGELFRFSMKSAELGTDEDGDPITVGVVDDAVDPSAHAAVDWPAGCQDLRDALTEALLDGGFDYGIPKGPTVRAAHLDAVRAIFRRRFIGAVEDDPQRPHRRADVAFDNQLRAARKARRVVGETAAGKQVVWSP